MGVERFVVTLVALSALLGVLHFTNAATTTAAGTTTSAATTTTVAATTTTTGPGGSTPPAPPTTTAAPTTAVPFVLRHHKYRLKKPYTSTFTHSKIKNHTRTPNITLSATAASRSHSSSIQRTLTLSQIITRTRSANSSFTDTASLRETAEVTESRTVSLGITRTHSLRLSGTVTVSSTKSLVDTHTVRLSVSSSTSATVSVSLTTSDAPPVMEIIGPNTINEDSLTQTILLNLDDGSERTLADSVNQRNIFFQVDNDHWNTLMDLKGIYKLGRNAPGGQPTEAPSSPPDSSDAVRSFFFSRMTIRAPGSDDGSNAVNNALSTLVTSSSIVVGNRSLVIFFNVMPSFVLPSDVTDPIPVEVTFGKYLYSRAVAPYTYQYFYISPSVRRVRSLTLTTSSHVDIVTALCIVVSAASLVLSPVASGALVMEAPLAAGLQPLATCSGLTDTFATLASPFPRFNFGTELTSATAGCVITSLAWIWILLAFYGITVYFVASLKRMTPGEAFRYVRAPGVIVILFCLIPAATRCSFAVLWASFLLPSARHNSTATGLAMVLLLSWTLVCCLLAYLVMGCFGAERSRLSVDPFALFETMKEDKLSPDGKAPDPFGERRSRYARKTPKSKHQGLLATMVKEVWRGFRAIFIENVDIYLDAYKLDDQTPMTTRRRSFLDRMRDGWDDFLHYCYVERYGSYFTCYRYPWPFALFLVDLPLVVVISAMEGAAVASPSACMNVLGWLIAVLLLARAIFLIVIRPHNMPIASLMIGVIDAWRALAVFVAALGWVSGAKGPREAAGVMLVTGQYLLLAGQLCYLAWFMLPSLHRRDEMKHEVNVRRTLVVPTLIGGVKSADVAKKFNNTNAVVTGSAKPPPVVPREEVVMRQRSPHHEPSPLDRNLAADPLSSPLLGSPVGRRLDFLDHSPSWEGLTESAIGGRRAPGNGLAFRAYSPVPAASPSRHPPVVLDDPFL